MTAHATEHADYDAHGHKDHGHTIVNIWTLRAVLGVLVFFTLLTSGAAYFEEFVAYSFQIDFPQWVNVIVAMSIALVKATLVVLFFMQLKYDNPINSAVLIFTVFAVFLFLLFTLLDLHQRDTIDFYKADSIVYGGTGVDGGGKPVAVSALERAKDPNSETAPLYHPHHHEPEHSSAQMSRPVTGVTLEGYADPDESGEHGDELDSGGH